MTTVGFITISVVNVSGVTLSVLGVLKALTEHIADTVAGLIEVLEAQPLYTLILLSNSGLQYIGTAGVLIKDLGAIVP